MTSASLAERAMMATCATATILRRGRRGVGVLVIAPPAGFLADAIAWMTSDCPTSVR